MKYLEKYWILISKLCCINRIFQKRYIIKMMRCHITDFELNLLRISVASGNKIGCLDYEHLKVDLDK